MDQQVSEIKRGRYDEIVLSGLSPEIRSAVTSLIGRVGANDDEHGSWEFDAAFDSKGRGSAINWDLYAYGNDVHSGAFLCIVQVRRYEKVHKNWYPSIRKNYFLVGTNEDGTVFAHPLPSSVIRYAINHGRDAILAAQNWMFGTTDYSQIVRQGDVALLPCKRPPQEGEVASYERAANIEKSHLLVADEIRRNGNVYAKNPRLTHPTHPYVEARGWFKVVVSHRATYWKFAPPTVD